MNPTLSEFTGVRLFAVVLSTCVLVACGEAPQPEEKEIVRPVKLMTLGAGGAGTTREYPGEVSATQSVELGFEVPGKIVELPISDGVAVKGGDLLGRLDATDYEAARNAADANRKAMESAYQRAKRIFDQGAGSQAEVDRTLRDIDVSKEDLKKAQKALNDTALKAPFSGKVARKIAKNFQNVMAKQAILLLQDISSLELDVNIPEQDFVRMKTGVTLEQHTQRSRPEITVSTIPDLSFPARLISFETTADPVTRTYQATFAFDNPADVNVLPGMTARVILHLPGDMLEEAGAGGFLIPAAATVVDSDGAAYVWRYDPDSMQVSRTTVTLGDMSGASIRVLSGLQGGDRIAVSGAAHLQEGMKVRQLNE
jgi:RND family efflux transporter MFP subunit